MPVDKLLWNTRMYPGCVSASESAAELGRRLTDAQAQIEALQREVNTLNQLLRDKGLGQGEIDGMAADVDLQTALDAERDRLREALQGILEIGKRDMTNPKYDGYFEAAQAALTPAGGGQNGKVG